MTTGYLPQDVITQLKIFADKAEIDTKQLSSLIDSYTRSQQVRSMYDADRYYLGKHDILDKQREYYVDGLKQIDTVSSNAKIANPYLSILINQKVSKICGKPVSYSVSGANNKEKPNAKADSFQQLLNKQLGITFDDKIEDWITGSSKHSVEWMHFYIDPKGQLKYIVCPAQQILPIYDMEYENELQYVLRFYQYDFINASGNPKQLYKVEWWSKEDVTYYTQSEDGMFMLDGVAPHWTIINDVLKTKEGHGWGKVPFVGLQNNSKGQNDLQEIKALIDAQDKVVSGWCDDINDFAEQILVIKNLAIKDRELYAGMTELAVMVKNLKQHRAIAVDGEGGVTNLKTEIPVEAKEKFLKLTRESIFYFGEGVDVGSDKFGNSPSGVALQHLYALLDMKCNRTVLKLSQALKEFFWFVTEYINVATGNSFDSYEIVFTFNQSMIFNKKEMIDGIKARDYLSLKTRLSLDPDIDDVEEELKRLEDEKKNGEQQKEPDKTDIKVEETK